jgi:hypothetical protein
MAAGHTHAEVLGTKCTKRETCRVYCTDDSLASVAFAFDLWDIGRRDFASVQLVPVDLGEPAMREDV